MTATAAMGLPGASPVHAAASDPRIGFIHGTALDSDLELSFFEGLT
jgi:hypothetical protein